MRILISPQISNADKYHKVTTIVIPKRIVEELKIKHTDKFMAITNKKGQIVFSRKIQKVGDVK